MDRFASITAFVRVAESGGFSAAGRRLSLSKATVSDQVQALENALGARLLNRTTRRVSLTEIGRGYYDRCVQILPDLEEREVDPPTGPTMIDLVQEAFDLGISPFPPPDATLIRRRLGTLSLMVCGAPAYLQKHPAPHSPADVSR